LSSLSGENPCTAKAAFFMRDGSIFFQTPPFKTFGQLFGFLS
jgi:hypothetical protein